MEIEMTQKFYIRPVAKLLLDAVACLYLKKQ